jgi:hypothetical protein
MNNNAMISQQKIEPLIYTIRNKQVMLDYLQAKDNFSMELMGTIQNKNAN